MVNFDVSPYIPTVALVLESVDSKLESVESDADSSANLSLIEGGGVMALNMFIGSVSM